MGTAEDAGTAQGRWLHERGLSGLAGGGRRRAGGVGWGVTRTDKHPAAVGICRSRN